MSEWEVTAYETRAVIGVCVRLYNYLCDNELHNLKCEMSDGCLRRRNWF